MQLLVRYVDAEGATIQATRVDRPPGSVTCRPTGGSSPS